MNTQKRIMKIIVVFILLVFLLSSALVSVMYLTNKNTSEVQTGDVAELSGIVDTGVSLTGN